jgi:hypothetical protein
MNKLMLGVVFVFMNFAPDFFDRISTIKDFFQIHEDVRLANLTRWRGSTSAVGAAFSSLTDD